MKSSITTLVLAILLATALQSAEIVPIWHNESVAGDIQDMELLKGGDQFIILAGEGPEAQIQIRNTEDGELVRFYTTPISTGSKLQITPDSTRVLMINGSYGQLRNLDSEFSILQSFHLESDSIKLVFKGLAIDPIRPFVYVSAYGRDYINGKYQSASKIMLYNYETGQYSKDLTELGEYKYTAMGVSNDGKYFAAINEGEAYLKLWELESMEVIRNLQLYDESTNDNWCEPIQIEFSSLNENTIFLSGLFTKQINDVRTSGVFKFDFIINERDRIASNSFYGGGKFALFNLETNVIVPRAFSFAILNLSSNVLEFINKPKDGIFADEKVIYISNNGSFIGFSENNLSRFSYDSKSVINLNDENIIKISPNPTRSFVNIKLNCVEPTINYQINDVNGLMIYKSSVQNNSGNLQIDYTAYPVGVYFITINCNVSKTYKIFKEG